MIKTAANPKEAFCRSLQWKIKIDWFDLTGIHNLDRTRRVLITLDYSHVHENYDGFKVRIVDKHDGTIDTKFFRFDDFLSREKRVDGRMTDYPLGPNRCFQVIAHCGWQWYIAIPDSTRPFCEAAERWIKTWL